jgi:hypothetical protein
MGYRNGQTQFTTTLHTDSSSGNRLTDRLRQRDHTHPQPKTASRIPRGGGIAQVLLSDHAEPREELTAISNQRAEEPLGVQSR